MIDWLRRLTMVMEPGGRLVCQTNSWSTGLKCRCRSTHTGSLPQRFYRIKVGPPLP